MKALIIAGGEGTRLSPFTKVVNKHLLPVGREPMLYWPLMKLKEAGMNEIAIVTMEKDLDDFIKILGDGSRFALSLRYFTQTKPDGIASAIRCASRFIANEKSLIMLGDNLFAAPLSPYIEAYKRLANGAMVLIKKVDNPTHFAVATVYEHQNKVESIIEKPKRPMSNLCVTGIYFFDEQLLEKINSSKRSIRQEYEITDINNAYAKKGQLYYQHLEGWWLDAGTHESLFAANQRLYEEERRRKQ